ncbi:PREDICTED: short transient receptor potential channel 2-like isoform X2 [Wasmannia auropunctata]|uniref:short transient receptor potential channel 2-like isoform X2 n=1 Tax=Wasmannia auropunctata TaxID=64793 RepID=UPI0005EEB670|nr:PREDICTED: short transient receptor potential channel 2-like isoform X2 [Wasmannia auropunctata]
MMVCSKSHDNKLIEEFILMSPAPVDTAAKLSNIYMKLSEKETERAKDLITAGKLCEAMAIELLTLAAGIDSADKILTSIDHRNVQFLDVLIENEQKDIIAHTVVQRYLKELWQGSVNWNMFKTILLFIVFIVCPPVWMMFALPLGHKYNNVPIIKFITYFTSHIYLMVFLLLVGITPNSVQRNSLIPYWYEFPFSLRANHGFPVISSSLRAVGHHHRSSRSISGCINHRDPETCCSDTSRTIHQRGE